MIAILLSIPVLILLTMIQTVVVSRMPLLNGTADLILLVLAAWGLHERVRSAWAWALVAGGLMAYVSALPPFIPVVCYLILTLIARILNRRVWQMPILAMFVTTVAGTLAYHMLSMIILSISGTPLPLRESLVLVILPSTLLNLILALPIYALVNDMVNWVHPAIEVEA